MPASALAAATRYFLPGTTKVLILPAVTNLTPTRVQIDAGTDVSGHVAAIDGWLINSESVPTPDLGVRFVKQVTGRLTAADSSITFWTDVAGVDIRDELTLDQETYVVFMDGGDVEASFMDVYQVTVASVGKVREIEGAGRIQVRFTIRDYNEDVAIPAVA